MLREVAIKKTKKLEDETASCFYTKGILSRFQR